MIGNWYNLMGTIAVAPGGTTFPAQQKDPNTGSFLRPANGMKANVQQNLQPALRISDDYQMAIEETDLNRRQAKCFFAASGLIGKANTDLQRVGSHFELVSLPETIEVYVPWKRQKYVLNKVVPRVVGRVSPKPLKMKAEQLCNEFASQLTGGNSETQLLPVYGSNSLAAPSRALHTEVELVVAQLVAKAMGTERRDVPEFRKGDVVPEREYRLLRQTDEGNAEMKRRETRAVNEIARKYVQALRSGGSQQVLRDLGINEFAAPEIGDSFVTKSVSSADPRTQTVTDIRTGKTFTPLWGYHYGGVVAKSGNDVVTLENYARLDEDKSVADPKPVSGQDPRWFFQMYSTRNAKQTFHQAQIATGGFANPMTFALRNPRRQTGQMVPVVPQPLLTPPRVTNRQLAAGSTLLVLIAGVVLKRYGLI